MNPTLRGADAAPMNHAPGSPASETCDETLLALVREVCAELHPGLGSSRPVTLDSALDRDLGFDSLGRVELLRRIERRYGARLAETMFAAAETPRDLLQALRQGDTAPPAVQQVPLRPQAVEEPGAQEIPTLAKTLVEVLDWHVQAHPERLHVQFHEDDGEGEALSYRRLLEGAEALAGGLQHRGLQSGQAVTIMLPTGRDYLYAFFGTLLAGGVPVPLYPPTRPAQLEDHLRRQAGILANCRSPLLITLAEARPLARLVKAQVETLRLIVTADELATAGESYLRPTLEADDTAFLQYTSGSTGNPKGVILSHANLLANIRADGEAIRAGLLAAYRWQFILSGAQEPRYNAIICDLISEPQADRIVAALDPIA